MLKFRFLSLVGPIILISPIYAGVTTCMPGTLDQYLGITGTVCQTGDRGFSDFQFTSSSPDLIPADIHVQPLSNGGFYFPVSVNISSNPDGSAATLDFSIAYEITTPSNEQVAGIGLDFNGGGFFHGTTLMTTSYCVGMPVAFCPAGAGGQMTLDPADSTGTLTIANSSSPLFVTMSVDLNSGDQGSAYFLQMENAVQLENVVPLGQGGVPEPASIWLAGLGLAALAKFLPDRQSRRWRGPAESNSIHCGRTPISH